MENQPEQPSVEPRRVSRRQMIAGTGLAAAAWAAPSIVHIDVASAAGSGLFTVPSMLTVQGGVTPDACITLTGVGNTPISATANTTSISMMNTIGPFDMEMGGLGHLLQIAVSGVPMGTTVTVTVTLCYRSAWEPDDQITVTLNGSMLGMPILPGPTSTVRCDLPNNLGSAVHNIAGDMNLVISSTANANAEEFGVANVTLAFS